MTKDTKKTKDMKKTKVKKDQPKKQLSKIELSKKQLSKTELSKKQGSKTDKKIVSASKKKKVESKNKKPSFALKDKNFIFYFLLLFLLTQIIGLFTSFIFKLLRVNISLVGDPNSIWNAVFIVGYIIFLTALILVLKKFIKSGKHVYVFEFIPFFFAISLFLKIFMTSLLAYFFTLLLLYFKNKFASDKLNLWYNNFLLVVAIAVAGSLMGLGLGVIPIIFLLFFLGIYDIIAVFYTKHMISLADLFISKDVAFLFKLPSKERVYNLGGGDFALPTAVSASLFSVLIMKYPLAITLIPILFVWIAAIAGMFLTFYILDKYKTKALPALPIQVSLIIVILFLTYFIML